MMSMRVWAAIPIIILWPTIGFGGTYSTDQAATHIGETATVCGTVADTHYAEGSKGAPTFLNLDQPYPHQIFTVVIWGEDRPAFGSPEATLMGKHICTTGRIELYRGHPEIILRSPSQLGQ
jgi:DNA/RNA endonuclease YhcR with UshA esterase domain